MQDPGHQIGKVKGQMTTPQDIIQDIQKEVSDPTAHVESRKEDSRKIWQEV